MPSPSAAAAPILALYRAVRRVHREKLPPPLRRMGDAYVRDEFSRHLRGATTPAQWQAFASEWGRYRGMLAGAADMAPGAAASFADGDLLVGGVDRSGALEEGALRAMTPEQRDRLLRLREEAGRVGRELLGTPAGGGGGGGGGKSAA
jgi:hypothetical protein